MKPLLISDVAATLGVSVSRVVALDRDLKPARTPNGTRVYDYDRVQAEVDRRVSNTLAKQGQKKGRTR